MKQAERSGLRHSTRFLPSQTVSANSSCASHEHTLYLEINPLAMAKLKPVTNTFPKVDQKKIELNS